jgi:protein-S-isoprenylcysteine O-methyltransferase Ste14
MTLRALVGAGDRIALFVLPFVVVGVGLNVAFPSAFDVGGPSDTLRMISLAVLIPGVVIWLWSVALVLTTARRGKLITGGPYGWVKHPIYTSVALLVLPWLGFLLNTWVGALIGVALYVASKRYAPDEEAVLAETFGGDWSAYAGMVRFPWL